MKQIFTAKMAYQLVSMMYSDYEFNSCLEFKDYFCFGYKLKNSDEKLLNAFKCISKYTGKQIHVSPFADLDQLEKAKPIDIGELK